MEYPIIDTLRVSNSSLGTLNSCHAKFEFAKIYNVFKYESSHAATTGNAIHAGIQLYAQTGNREQAIFEMLKKYPYEFNTSKSDIRSWQACVGTIEKAFDFWDKGDLHDWEVAEIEDANGNPIPAIEVPFKLVLRNVPFYKDGRTVTIVYVGYIDFILRHKHTGQYAVSDIKSTVKVADMEVEFLFDTQCVPYGLVLETLLGQDYRKGFDVFYWIINIHPLEPVNQLMLFKKSELDVQEWMMSFLQDVQTIRNNVDLKFFRKNNRACNGYKRPCKWFDLCRMRDKGRFKYYIPLAQREGERWEEEREQRVEPWISINLEYQV